MHPSCNIEPKSPTARVRTGYEKTSAKDLIENETDSCKYSATSCEYTRLSIERILFQHIELNKNVAVLRTTYFLEKSIKISQIEWYVKILTATKNKLDKTDLPGNGACVALVAFELASGAARLFLGCKEAGSSYSQTR